MPKHLRWAAAEDDRWKALEDPSGSRGRFLAHRRHRQARAAYLATLNTCPVGVHPGEFLRAHGFAWSDVGEPKTRHLNY